MKVLFRSLWAGLWFFGGVGYAEPVLNSSVNPTCLEHQVINPQPSPLALPDMVSGRVSFYLAEYDPATMCTVRAYQIGPVDEVRALASLYKAVLVEAVLRDVEAGRLALGEKITTTPETRSIEEYPPGTNRLVSLAKRAIYNSDNTAADLLMWAYGPDRFTRLVCECSACTQVFLTTKAMWAAQSGMLPDVIGPDMVSGTREYAQLSFEDRLARATALNQAARQLSGPEIERRLDEWYIGPEYQPEVDLFVQPTSTARAFTDLMARTATGANLSVTRSAYRTIMGSGCCKPAVSQLPVKYWGRKAGSGWRFLNLSGVAELQDGRLFAYTYLNDQSDVDDTLYLEQQLKPLAGWIEALLRKVSAECEPA